MSMADKRSLLIVDDDPLIVDTLAYALGKDFDVMVSDSRSHAVSLVRRLDTPPQLALVDLGSAAAAPAGRGLPARRRTARALPGDENTVLSGQNDAANARQRAPSARPISWPSPAIPKA
jgi:two-component system nitrogen regulation response regulator GlnG